MNKILHLPQLPGWVLSYAAHDGCWRLWREVSQTHSATDPDVVDVLLTLTQVEAASPETALLIQHPPGYDPKKLRRLSVASPYRPHPADGPPPNKQPDGGTK